MQDGSFVSFNSWVSGCQALYLFPEKHAEKLSWRWNSRQTPCCAVYRILLCSSQIQMASHPWTLKSPKGDLHCTISLGNRRRLCFLWRRKFWAFLKWSQEFNCEICGNHTYKGRREFERHFREWRHQNSMRAMGIPNNKNFFEITKIKDAQELWQNIQVSLPPHTSSRCFSDFVLQFWAARAPWLDPVQCTYIGDKIQRNSL